MAGSPPTRSGAVVQIGALGESFFPTRVGACDVCTKGHDLLLEGIVKELLLPIPDLLALGWWLALGGRVYRRLWVLISVVGVCAWLSSNQLCCCMVFVLVSLINWANSLLN